MKTKSVITIVSVALNVALFCALAHFNKVNNRAEGTSAPFFRAQHMPGVSLSQGETHGITLADSSK